MDIPVECKKCGSKELILIIKKRSDINYFYCGRCLTFQKFLNKEEAKKFIDNGE